MAITDLTNTTWYVPSGWLTSLMELELGLSANAWLVINGTDGIGLALGYSVDDSGGFPTQYGKANSIATASNAGLWLYSYDNSISLTIEFLDEESAISAGYYTNPALISWLTDNNAVQLKVDDLTDTTWTVNAGWEAEAGYGQFLIRGSSSLAPDLLGVDIGYDVDGADYIPTANLISCNASPSVDNTTGLEFNITGGTDIKNPKLIAWLSKYGELQVEEEGEAPPDDLTGYTVTVPAGWTAMRAYTTLELNCSFDNTVVSDTANPLTIKVGYAKNGSSYADSIQIINPYTEASYGLGNSYPITFVIGEGFQSNSTIFIQWLADNNATFTKEGEEEPEEPDTPEEPTVTSQGEIYYDGNLVDTLIEGEFIVLHAKDFKFLGDIVIKNVGEVEEETPTLISFTFSNTEFQAEEGMTWREWVESDYSEEGSYISSDGIVGVYLGNIFIGAVADVNADEEIEDGKAYTATQMPV